MPRQIPQSQTRLAVDDGPPIVIDVENGHDEVFSALSNERRRTALCVLVRESAPMDLETLTEQVARLESGTERVSQEQAESVRLTLYHAHLPKLDELELIEFDTEDLVVERLTETVSSVPA